MPPPALHGLLSLYSAWVASATSTGLSQLFPVRHAGVFCLSLINPQRKVLLPFSATAADRPCFPMLYRVLFRNNKSDAEFDVSAFAGSQTAAVAVMLSAVYLPGDATTCRFL